ncbi:MAG: TonB-dependent receptor [Opitutus sp.]|nr:TonB-dependent receptor [Opitutus sp.]MCS6246245.1 TonB-dependent receptor [Opitutus sp.]MCS6274110.1 TonB-dependent receptor [Opitutus sp.]MCS6277252.1 TonB-dependent receptor [Opitutus sp.]MCS6300374.1 TonB-dependent receptor [Opitutus sp.]
MKFSSRSLLVNLVLAAVLRAEVSPPVAAPTTAEKTVVLPELEVTASRTSLTTPSREAARADLALTPGGAEVVAAERYLQGRASTVADTFALSPGVVAQSRFGSDEARLSIRGSGIQRTFHGRGLRVLQDGVPINLADGGFDMQSLEPTAADHIVIWRGSNALAYGSSTLGGAIDYVSRTGRTAPGGFARLEVGCFDYLRATVADGVAQGNADGYASFTQSQQEGFRDHAEQNNQRLFTNVGWRLSDEIETRLYLTAVKTDSELPGSLTKAQMEANPEQANASNITGNQKRDYQLVRVANKTTVSAGDSSVDFIAAWTYKNLDHPIFQVIDQVTNDALIGLTLTNKTDLFERAHQNRAGLLANQGQTSAANFVNVGGSRGALVSQDDQIATNLEAFAESQLSLGAGFTSVLGFAAAHNRRDTARTLGAVTAANTYDRSYENLAPKLGARWDNAAKTKQVYANVSGSYEPPSFSEGGNATVANEAQQALTYELGTRGTHGFVRWDASVYYAQVEDELLAISLPGPVSGTFNADRTTHQGVELGFEADVLGQPWSGKTDNRLVARGAWTYGRFNFENDRTFGDNTLAGLPEHLFRGEFVWQNAAGYYAGPTFEWVPVKAFVDHANTLAADPYSLVGFKFGRRLERGLSWFVEFKNLTDETYAATTGVIERFTGGNGAQFLPGDSRSVYAGVEYRF